jgi:hypothetical protein
MTDMDSVQGSCAWGRGGAHALWVWGSEVALAVAWGGFLGLGGGGGRTLGNLSSSLTWGGRVLVRSTRWIRDRREAQEWFNRSSVEFSTDYKQMCSCVRGSSLVLPPSLPPFLPVFLPPFLPVSGAWTHGLALTRQALELKFQLLCFRLFFKQGLEFLPWPTSGSDPPTYAAHVAGIIDVLHLPSSFVEIGVLANFLPWLAWKLDPSDLYLWVAWDCKSDYPVWLFGFKVYIT